MIDPVHLVGTVLPRLVGPFFPDVLWRVAGNERVVYFTFDDGPTLPFTETLLEMLDRHEAKATFFLVGRYAERHPHLVQAIAASGHTLGNHTFSHRQAWKHPAAVVTTDLKCGAEAIEAITGEPVRLVRPPWGQFTRAIRSWCQRHRQLLTMWDVGPGDFLPGATARKVEHRVLRAVRPGSIIVLHDHPVAEGVLRTALPRILQRLSQDGWKFQAL